VTGLKTLIGSAWLLVALAVLGMAEDVVSAWLGDARGLPHLFVNLALLVVASALTRTHRLLAAQAAELAGLRDAARGDR
jgi:hypothetical protein